VDLAEGFERHKENSLRETERPILVDRPRIGGMFAASEQPTMTTRPRHSHEPDLRGEGGRCIDQG
jgi:hypothetical protein